MATAYDAVGNLMLTYGPHSGRAITADQMNSERFWSHVSIGTDDECWPWEAYVNQGGYGAVGVSRSRRIVPAHRAAYALANGFTPAGKIVRHSCDNPPCCNPKHLLLGTQKDNGHDMAVRNRIPDRTGERNSNAKMSDADVIRFHKLFAIGTKRADLAALFSITRGRVSQIINDRIRVASS